MPVNYILVGMPGAGKSTVGQILTDMLNFEYIDLDNLIIAKAGCSIPEIFSTMGEEYFRDIETSVIKSLLQCDKKVIAAGGGTCERSENRDMLNKIGSVIYLYAPPEIIYNRIKNQTGRPLLMCDNPREKIEILFKQRHNNYKQSRYTIDTAKLNPYNTADSLMRLINGENSGN